MPPRFGGPLARINWDHPLLSSEELQPYRALGDPLADDFIAAVSRCSPPLEPPAEDDLPSASTHDEKPHLSRAYRILEAIATDSTYAAAVPEEVRVCAQRLWDDASREPHWLDRNLLRRGQDVFLERATPSFMVLLYGSLTGGFAAPWIVPVLKATGYLTSADPKSAVRRLLETTSYVIDCVLDTGFPIHGPAWKSSVSVRLLHTQVRQRLAKTPFWTSGPVEWGVPINQEDQAVTLLSFSLIVLIGLEDMGFKINHEDKTAYLHLWRYAGFLLGVDDRVNFCSSLANAWDGLSSLLVHLLHPDETSAAIANSLLDCMTHLPGNIPRGIHAAFCYRILGADLCRALRIKEPSMMERLIAATSTMSVRCLVGAHHAFPFGLGKGVLRKRSRSFCRALVRMTIKQAAGFEMTPPIKQGLSKLE